jgi:nucleoid-associated protein YgaU
MERSSTPRAATTTAAAVLVAVAAPVTTTWLSRRPTLALRDELAAGRSWAALPLDLLITAGAGLALSLLALWVAVSAVATAVEAAWGCSSAVVRSCTPSLVRRTVLACCGVAIGSTAVVVPAAAALDAGSHDRPGSRLAGLALPDRPTGGLPPVRRVSTPDHDAQQHRVRAGECLWSIAADLLPQHASAARVEATWRAIYRRNREAVGSDPHLITTGTVLVLPPPPAGPRPSPTHHSREDAS